MKAASLARKDHRAVLGFPYPQGGDENALARNRGGNAFQFSQISAG